MCVRLEENNLGLYVRGSNKMLLKGVKKVGIVQTENHVEKENFKKNSQNEFKNKWHKMQQSVLLGTAKMLRKVLDM